MAWKGLTAAGPAEMGMYLLRGDETSKKIIVFAYGMEEGLRGFYSTTAERTDDSEVVDLLTKLIEVEKNHKQRLFDLYLTHDSGITDREVFEAQRDSWIVDWKKEMTIDKID